MCNIYINMLRYTYTQTFYYYYYYNQKSNKFKNKLAEQLWISSIFK